MNRPLRITIVNAYSVQNRGDAAIVYAMVRFVRNLAPNCQISILSSFAEENREYYQACGAESLPAIFDIGGKGSPIKKYLRFMGVALQSLLQPQGKKFAPIREADWILAAGGGYLYSSRRGPLGLGLLGNCFHIWLGTRFKKLTVLFPQSVGPLLHGADRWLCRIALRRLALVCCRERVSLEQALEMKIGNARLVPDIAFLLADHQVRKATSFSPKKIGISVLDWRFANRAADEEAIEYYLEKIKQVVCDFHAADPDVQVEIFPQVTVGKGLGDQSVSARLCELIGAPWARVTNLDDCAYPEAIMAEYARMDVFIGSRMHSAILAMCAGTPTVALAYQPKTQGTFEAIGLGQFSLDITDFTTQSLADAVKSAAGQGEEIRGAVQAAQLEISEKLRALFQEKVIA
ncbi:MAG: polysaccharide pyruvyl transferase family protein [Chthoniobacterales bacterium]